jgi:beta-phosphoglucomutase-like phosphatase (HAD superfamily)
VVFEDAEAGISAAKAAGCYSVGIGTANISHANMVLQDGLANVNVQQVLTHLQAHHSNHE